MKKQNDLESYEILIGICLSVIAIWWVSGYLINEYYSYTADHSDRGTFGDMFGAINALFSGLAFAGIIYTIHIQRKELQLQRRELELQREEIRNSTKELAEQKHVMTTQLFETTFFNLLSLHNELTNKLISSNFEETGRAYLREISSIIRNGASDEKPGKDSFEYIYPYEKNALSHYIRNTNAIIKYVEDSHHDQKTKSKYIDIFKAQLSSHELLIYYYYSIHDFFTAQYNLMRLHPYGFFNEIEEILEKLK